MLGRNFRGNARVDRLAGLVPMLVAPLDYDEAEKSRHIHLRIELDSGSFEPGGELRPEVECYPAPVGVELVN